MISLRFYFVLCALWSASNASQAIHVGDTVQICVPVTDLQGKPLEHQHTDTAYALSKHLPHQLAHLVYGQEVRVKTKGNKWSLVECPMFPSPEHTHNLCGWIRNDDIKKGDQNILYNQSDVHTTLTTQAWTQTTVDAQYQASTKPLMLPLGSCLTTKQEPKSWRIMQDGHPTPHTIAHEHAIDIKRIQQKSIDEKRWLLCRWAKQFIDTPYCWGGGCAWYPGLEHHTTDQNKRRIQRTGIDCSMLVHIVYRMVGTILPRNSAQQWRVATPINPTDMMPGDLIFQSRGPITDPRIYHVMIYLGEGNIIESTGNNTVGAYKVRIASIETYIGLPLHKCKQGMQTKNMYWFFGSVLPPC